MRGRNTNSADPDRLILADIAGSTARHTPLSGWLSDGDVRAVADVAAAARGRADLLAWYAGHCLGLSAVEPVDQFAVQLVAKASLSARAGADMDQVARWIPEGTARGEHISASQRPR
jgi:hypothetical protein